MGVVFVALALVSGFIFTSLHLPARYKQKRSQGWESYFHVATWGSLYMLLGAIISIIADYFNFVSLLLNKQHHTLAELNSTLTLSIASFKVLAVALITLSITVFFGYLSKIIYSNCIKLKTRTVVKLIQNDRLESLLMESSITQSPILLNLKSKKAYVGICLTEPSIDSNNDFIEILPLLSGYREKDTLELKLITNYHSHYKTEGIFDESHDYLTLEDFRTIVSKSELDSVSYFNIETFNNFQKKEKEKTKIITVP